MGVIRGYCVCGTLGGGAVAWRNANMMNVGCPNEENVRRKSATGVIEGGDH